MSRLPPWRSPWLTNGHRLGARALHARVGEELLTPAAQHDAAGLERVPAIAELERFHHTLLDERDGEPPLPADPVIVFRDSAGRCEAEP